MKRICFLLIMFLITGCAAVPREPPVKYVTSPSFNPNKHCKLAVLVESNKELPSRMIEDEFMKLLIAKGYTISSRSDVESIMKELKFQHSGLTDDNASEVGRMLNIPAVLIVSLTNCYRRRDFIRLTLGTRMIDVEKGDVIWLGSCEDSGYSFGITGMISNAIAKKMPTIRSVYNVEPGRYIQCISSPSFNPNKIDKVAVLVKSRRQMPTRAVEDEFIRLLIEKGYTVSSRSDIEIIMKELKFQHSGLTDDNASEVGRMLNVPAVLIVDMTYYNKQRGEKGYYSVSITLDARFIDVEKNEILWIGTKYDFESYEKGTLAGELAEELARNIPPRL